MIYLRRGLVRIATDGVVSLLHSELDGAIKRRGVRRARDTDNPSPSLDETGCQPCQFHAQIAEAYLLLRQAAERTEATGNIPSGVGGTIPVARQRLADAERELTEIAASRPDLRTAGIELQGHVTSLGVDLAGQVQPGALSDLRERAERCWELSYNLVLAYFESPPEPGTPAEAFHDDPLYQLIRRARADDWDADRFTQELRETLAKEPSRA